MTQIVGILNLTPDSFSDGASWNNPGVVIDRVETLFAEGADIIDLGAESTRPGAIEVQAKEEWQRLKPAIANIRERYPANIFSIDTRHARVAELAIQHWSDELIINDVSGLHYQQMVDVAIKHGSRVIINHLPKEANGDIQRAHRAKETSLDKIISELHQKTVELVNCGLDPRKIIVDPGIGFGKHPDLNWQLLGFAQYTDYPTMLGYSRKKFLGERRLDPKYNAEIGQIAAAAGAAYLRVHDVAAHASITNSS